MEPLRGTAWGVSRTQGARRSAATLGYSIQPLRGSPKAQLPARPCGGIVGQRPRFPTKRTDPARSPSRTGTPCRACRFGPLHGGYRGIPWDTVGSRASRSTSEGAAVSLPIVLDPDDVNRRGQGDISSGHFLSSTSSGENCQNPSRLVSTGGLPDGVWPDLDGVSVMAKTTFPL